MTLNRGFQKNGFAAPQKIERFSRITPFHNHICQLHSLLVILFVSMIIKDTMTTYVPFSGISCTSLLLQSRLAFSLELRFAFLKTVTALKFCFHQGGDTMVHWCHLKPKRPEKLFLRLLQHSPVFCR